MKITRTVKKILDNYESDCPGTKANLARILMHGRLGGSGKMVILPVDQGFEHGPARSFAPNPAAYDPHYHFQLAIDAGDPRHAHGALHEYTLAHQQRASRMNLCHIVLFRRVSEENSLSHHTIFFSFEKFNPPSLLVA